MDYHVQNEQFIREKQTSILIECCSILKKKLLQEKANLLQQKQDCMSQYHSFLHDDYFISIETMSEIRRLNQSLKEIEMLLHKISSVEEEIHV